MVRFRGERRGEVRFVSEDEKKEKESDRRDERKELIGLALEGGQDKDEGRGERRKRGERERGV